MRRPIHWTDLRLFPPKGGIRQMAITTSCQDAGRGDVERESSIEAREAPVSERLLRLRCW
jgi:hypothetical protein